MSDQLNFKAIKEALHDKGADDFGKA